MGAALLGEGDACGQAPQDGLSTSGASRPASDLALSVRGAAVLAPQLCGSRRSERGRLLRAGAGPPARTHLHAGAPGPECGWRGRAGPT